MVFTEYLQNLFVLLRAVGVPEDSYLVIYLYYRSGTYRISAYTCTLSIYSSLTILRESQ